MRTFLACCGLDGHTETLARLRHLVEERRPHAVLFAGGLFSRAQPHESPSDAAERQHFETTLLDSFFSTLGRLDTFCAVIPGPRDAPLRAVLRAGLHAQSQYPGIRLVHARVASDHDVAISGIGGEVTDFEDIGEPVVRISRTTADYFLRDLQAADESQRILLCGVPPIGKLGGDAGNAIVAELIDTLHPKLCVAAGCTEQRGSERVAHTTIVNPGRLSDGAAAWIDWSETTEKQVQMIEMMAGSPA